MTLSEELKSANLTDKELKIVDGFTVDDNSSLFDVYSQATINNHPSIANKIAALNVDLQDGKYGWSLVHIAIRNDCMEAFDYLLDNGADLEVMDGVGWNPLMESIVDDKVEFAKTFSKRV